MGVGKTWTILGNLHAFSGDVKFCEYLALSDSFIRDSAERESRDSLPVLRIGFCDVVKHGEATKLFTGKANPEEVESYLAREISFPAVIATEAQVSQVVLQSSIVTINRVLRKQGAGAAWTGGGDREPGGDGTSNIRGVGGGFNSACFHSVASHHSDHYASALQPKGMGIMPDFGACENAAER
ncbi:unnamed protein product [Ectocarpus sp. 12 AP-2014]